MNDTILTTLIMAAASIICQLLINANNRKKRLQEDAEKEKARAVEEAKKEERLSARLNNIERTLEENNRKLDIHNGYADKIGNIQMDLSYIKGKIEEKGD